MSVPNNTDVQRPAPVAQASLEVEVSEAPPEGAGEPQAREPAGLLLDPGLLARIQQRLKATPDLRREKVEPLKHAIANGAYRVAFSDIAEAMLRERVRF